MGHDLGGTFALGPRRVRRAGYGAMQLAGDGVFGPPRDREEAVLVLRAAVEAGVDHIDTAQFYGAGTVNGLIREALRPYAGDLAIVSKVAARPAAAGKPRRGGPDQLRQGIEENLITLGVSRLAAVNLRMIDPAEPPGERFDADLAALVKAREEKLIDGVGLSNVSRQQLVRAAEQTEIVCVQNLFNLVDQGSADVLAECVKRGIAFVPFCPLGLPGPTRNHLLGSPVLAADGAAYRGGEVILAGGTYGSPAILLRSGVGPAGQLTALGIGVVADLPVGQRLQDQPGYYDACALAPGYLEMTPRSAPCCGPPPARPTPATSTSTSPRPT